GDMNIGDSAASGGLSVVADSTLSASTTVYSIAAGVGLGLMGAVGTATVSGRTAASFDGTATLTGAATISAIGRHRADVATVGFVSGVYAVGANVAEATVSRTTTATLTADSVIVAGGAVAVTADSRNAAATSADGGGLGGTGFSAMTTTSLITGTTDAIVLGRVLGSGSVAVSAIGRSRAASRPLRLAVPMRVGGSGVRVSANVTVAARIFARLASPTTVVSAGDVLVSAKTAPDGAGESIASAISTVGGGGAVSGAVYV